MTATDPLGQRIANQMNITETGWAPRHAVGVSNPQNTAECFKIGLPAQTTELGLLDDDEPMLVQFDEEVGLPVVATADYFGEMYGAYGEPDLRKVRGGTTTFPKTYTAYAHGGGHPQVDFRRDDVLGFFAPESKIANDFPRLYVGTLDDYKQLTQDCAKVIWGKKYGCPDFVRGRQKQVRVVFVVRPDEEPFHILYRSVGKWAPAAELF